MFSFFKPKARPVHTVQIAPLNLSLQIEKGENFLMAVQERGLEAPSNCRVGACKTCRLTVRSGSPRSLIEREYVFSPQEIADGAFLACQMSVESDMRVEWPGLAQPGTQLRTTATLQSVEKMTRRIARVHLSLAQPMSWHPGQFAKLLPESMSTHARSYSLINSGHEEADMAFDVTAYPGGTLSSWLTDSANIGRTVHVEAPFGQFGASVLNGDGNSDAVAPLLCIAGGSGLGAIGGILAGRRLASPVMLVYGARDHEEIYGIDRMATAQADIGMAPFRACPVLDREPEDSRWQGRRGFIAPHLPDILQEAIGSHPAFRAPLPAWQVLLCGPTGMVDSSLTALRDYGFQPEQMSFDKYEQQFA